MSHTHITDCRGLAISAPDADAVARLEAIINDIYYYRLGVQDRLDALIAECPQLVLAHVLKGYSLMTDGTLDSHPQALERLQAADALPANPRERLHREALRAWLEQDTAARAAAWEQVLVEWPLDLLALRQYTGTLFWMGDKRHQAAVMAGASPYWSRGIPGHAHFLSAHAFAMEEAGLYAVAERSARQALDTEPQDLWALHALAHVLEMQGRNEEGIATLEDAAGFLDDYNLFRGHLWWHLALFLLSVSRFDEALALFDAEIYPEPSGFYLDIQNGVSLLARLEFQGLEVGDERWQRLAQGSLPNATQCTIWFTAMHHVIALLRSGRLADVKAALDYLNATAAGNEQAGLAHGLSQAAAAFYGGHPDESLTRFLALRPRQGELGASHAQQDLYDQIAIMAAHRSGDLPRVRQCLKERRFTRVWDDASWQAYETCARGIDSMEDVEAIRAELIWKP